MASERMLMHQMEVKGKRLAFGLKKFIDEFESEHPNFTLAYAYALGCMGDDKSKTKLVKINGCRMVYEDLKSEKLVKEETADKLIAENKKRILKGDVTHVVEIEVTTPAEEEHQTAQEEQPLAVPLSDVVDSASQEIVDKPEEDATPSPFPNIVVITFDNKRQTVIGMEAGSDAGYRAYDRIMEYYQPMSRFVREFTMEDGSIWRRGDPVDIGDDRWELTYYPS